MLKPWIPADERGITAALSGLIMFKSEGEVPTATHGSDPGIDHEISGCLSQRFAKRTSSTSAFTLMEVLIAGVVLVMAALSGTQAMLHINRQAAISRVTNAAKAEALSRIQQVSQCAYNPKAHPPAIPSILETGTKVESLDLGSKSTDLGTIPATATWTVGSVPGAGDIRSVRCTIRYRYLNKDLSYELFTYKAGD